LYTAWLPGSLMISMSVSIFVRHVAALAVDRVGEVVGVGHQRAGDAGGDQHRGDEQD